MYDFQVQQVFEFENLNLGKQRGWIFSDEGSFFCIYFGAEVVYDE